MDSSNPDNNVSVTELSFLNAIDKAFVDAAAIMECSDLDPEAEDDDVYAEYEMRHHCGTCMVRTVMETVWPPVELYVEWLKSQIPVED